MLPTHKLQDYAISGFIRTQNGYKLVLLKHLLCIYSPEYE